MTPSYIKNYSTLVAEYKCLAPSFENKLSVPFYDPIIKQEPSGENFPSLGSLNVYWSDAKFPYSMNFFMSL